MTDLLKREIKIREIQKRNFYLEEIEDYFCDDCGEVISGDEYEIDGICKGCLGVREEA